MLNAGVPKEPLCGGPSNTVVEPNPPGSPGREIWNADTK